MMRILQLTDLHVNSDGRRAFLRADSLKDLQQTVDYILQVDLRPDVAIVTGDVSTDGSVSAYTLVQQELARLGCPVWVLPGNHDKKAEMKAVFADTCLTDLDEAPGLCVEMDEARLLLFDSAVENVPAGGLSEEKLDWLAERLDVPEGRPVMLWMHHFPFRTGYVGMDHPFTGEERLLEMLQGHNAYVCSGHIHAGILRRSGDVMLIASPAVSMLMELRLEKVRFFTERAGFAVHLVENGVVTTHLCSVPAPCSGGPYRFIE